MITGNDLSNMDFLLSLQESIIDQPEKRKKLIINLRNKIHKELSKLKIKCEKEK